MEIETLLYANYHLSHIFCMQSPTLSARNPEKTGKIYMVAYIKYLVSDIKSSPSTSEVFDFLQPYQSI